jgi:hypothetical protein
MTFSTQGTGGARWSQEIEKPAARICHGRSQSALRTTDESINFTAREQERPRSVRHARLLREAFRRAANRPPENPSIPNPRLSLSGQARRQPSDTNTLGDGLRPDHARPLDPHALPLGGAVGGGVAYAAFNNFQASTMNWQSFSQVAFNFAVTPQLLVKGIIWATLIGLIGGLLPALRAARLPIASALREL